MQAGFWPGEPARGEEGGTLACTCGLGFSLLGGGGGLSLPWLFPECLHPPRLTAYSWLGIERRKWSFRTSLAAPPASRPPPTQQGRVALFTLATRSLPAALRKQITVQSKVLACFLSGDGSSFERKVSCGPLHHLGLFYLSPPVGQGINLLPRAGPAND